MNCKAYRDEADAADLGDAPGAAARAHLALCDACRIFRDEREGLRRLLGGMGSVAAPADFEFRLRAAMRAGGGGPRPGLHARLFKPLSAALAACAAVAFTVAYLRAPADAPRQDLAAVTSSEAHAPAASQTQTPDAPATGTSASSIRDSAASDVAVVSSVGPKRDAQTRRATHRTVLNQSRGVKGFEEAARVTADSALRAAPVRTRLGSGGAAAGSNTPVPVQLSASRKPMRVVLRDERGASRVVSMRPVSFGSQEFVGRLNNSYRAPNSTKEGVW
ncbi:MAG TPA: hypothetical protein VF240_18905 [Pyrinomonadaceae bacterium]